VLSRGHRVADRVACGFEVPRPAAACGLCVITIYMRLNDLKWTCRYLNDVPPGQGGETVFPCCSVAGQRLLDADITHTHSAGRLGSNSAECQAAVELLESARTVCCSSSNIDISAVGIERAVCAPKGDGRALGIRPCKGFALLFYTRHKESGLSIL
jgi:hypothetical protein